MPKIGALLASKENALKEKERNELESQRMQGVIATANALGNSMQASLLEADQDDELKNLSGEMNELFLDVKAAEAEKETAKIENADTLMDGFQTQGGINIQESGMLQDSQMTMNIGVPIQEEPENALLTQQMGEQQGLKVDATQASFGVQQMPQMPQIAETAPKHKRGFFYRLLKGVVSAISACLLVNQIVSWSHKSKSAATLRKAREKAVRLGQQVEVAVEGQAQQEQAPAEQERKLDFRNENDATEAPLIWEQPQGFVQEEEAPTVEAHAKTGTAGSRSDEAGTRGQAHSFVVLRYCKKDYRTGRMRRFRVGFGLYPRFSVGATNIGNSAVIPGSLNNDTNHTSTTGRSYRITNEQVNAILNEAPKEVDKGYNTITHNCTTFVVNVLRAAGINDGGLYQEYMDVGNLELLLPGAKTVSSAMINDERKTLLKRMDTEDLSYERAGQKLVTYQDIQRYEQSLKYDNLELFGYSPGNMSEQLRAINSSGGGAVAMQNIDDIIKPENIRAKHDLIEKYKDTPEVAGVKSNILGPMGELIFDMRILMTSLKEGTSADVKKWNKNLDEEKLTLLNDSEGFDRRKGELVAAVQEWLGRLHPEQNKELHLLGYQLLGDLTALETTYYEGYNLQDINGLYKLETTNPELYQVFNAYGKVSEQHVLQQNKHKNPLYNKGFEKIFGSTTWAEVKRKLEESTEGKKKSEAAKLLREQGLIQKKLVTVGDLYKAEQSRFQRFAQQEDFKQSEVDTSFAFKPGTGAMEEWRTATRMVLMSRAMSPVISEVNAAIAGCEPQRDQQGVEVLGEKDSCMVTTVLLQSLQRCIRGDLFTKIVRSILHRDPKEKDAIIFPLFQGFIEPYINSKGQLLNMRYANLLFGADAVKFEKQEPYVVAMLAAREEFMAELDSVLDKVATQMQMLKTGG